MSKKIIIVVVIAIILVVSGVFYGCQDHVVLSKKFYVQIKEKNIVSQKIIYETPEQYPETQLSLKFSDEEYAEFLSKIKRSDYLSETFDDYFFLIVQSCDDWVPVNDIKEIYTLDTAEYSFLTCKRIQILMFATDSQDGYVRVFMTRN